MCCGLFFSVSLLCAKVSAGSAGVGASRGRGSGAVGGAGAGAGALVASGKGAGTGAGRSGRSSTRSGVLSARRLQHQRPYLTLT